MPEPNPRVDHLEQRIAQLEQAGEAGGGFWAKWRKWGVMRGDNVSGMLTAISTTASPTVSVLVGYLGPLYQKTSDTVISFGGTLYNRITQYADSNTVRLTVESVEEGGFVLGKFARVVTEIDADVPSIQFLVGDGAGVINGVYENRFELNVPLELDDATSDPSSPSNGWIYYNSTSHKIRAYINGAWVDVGGGALKVQNGGYYLIPAGPAVGTTVASSASADTYGSWTEMRAASGNALYIVGVTIRGLETVQYLQLDIGTGAAASETSVSETKVHDESTNTIGIDQTVYFPYPIAVAANIRIACRVADEDASAKNATITLIVVDQADVTTI